MTHFLKLRLIDLCKKLWKISAPINTDFVSPEDLEAIRNGVKIENKVSSFPKETVAQPITPHHQQPIAQQHQPYSPLYGDNDDRPVWGSSSISSANAQAQASNKHGGKDQTAGANTYNNNVNNEQGSFHNSGASSIGSNISEDGKKGQVASSNIQKQSSHTAEGLSIQESSQSQSANFDKESNSLLAADANTNTKHTVDKTGEKREQSSGSSATNQNQYGSGNSKAQVNTVEYNQNGVKGTKTDSVAQGIQINKDGSTSNSHAHSGTDTYKAPDGSEVTVSKAGSTNTNQGQNGSSGSSSNCGAQGGQNAHSNGFSSSFSSSSSSSFSNGNGQTVSNTGCESGSKTGPPVGFQVFPQVFQPNPFPYQFSGPFG